ncbi:MAG TPA: hypothetical protein DEQ17_00075 [Prevotella sp.]|nr:hypothetical protein [Prevotella sp.]
MAIIKCPECGRQISDKAPVCPNCGVEIAGKIIRCPQCGEIYFRDQEMCPNCHHMTRTGGQVGYNDSASRQPTAAANAQQAQQPQQPRQAAAPQPAPQPAKPKKEDGKAPASASKKKSHGPLIVAFIIALAICGACFYFYSNAKSNKEQEAYEFALKSDDPLVLQTYLDNNMDAPADHIQAITARLEELKKQDNDWTNAVVNGSRAALQDYLDKHPDSEHKAEAIHKIDSLDWVDASNKNTVEALQAYLDAHDEGEHVDEAQTAIKSLKAKTVQADEKAMVTSVFRHFFQAINAKSEDDLEATVAPILTNFLGKPDAIKADVVTFMHKIYKEDITSMTWRLNNDYKIDKKEVGDEEYQYNVSFSALQDINRTDDTKEKHARYKVSATVGPDGLISSMSMTKILE